MQQIFRQSAPSLEQKFQTMVGAYAQANSFLQFNDQFDLNVTAEKIAQLSPAQRDEWADLWGKAGDAVEAIPVPKDYLALLGKVHDASFQAVRQNYKGPDMHRLSFQERINFMQLIADAQTEYWQKTFPDIFADFKGTEVRGFHWDELLGPRQDAYSLWDDPSNPNHYYYRVPDNQAADIHWLSHVAAHEPQHSVQHHLVKKLREGLMLPPPLHDAAVIFSFYGNQDVGNLRPGLVCGDDGRTYDRLGSEVIRTYLKSPVEIPAFHQGNQMEAAMMVFAPPRLLPAPRQEAL